jgi:hypothetical protein
MHGAFLMWTGAMTRWGRKGIGDGQGIVPLAQFQLKWQDRETSNSQNNMNLLIHPTTRTTSVSHCSPFSTESLPLWLEILMIGNDTETRLDTGSGSLGVLGSGNGGVDFLKSHQEKV